MKKDPRINARTVTWGSYVVMYLLMTFICTATLVVYVKQVGMPKDQWFLFSIAGLVLTFSGVGCAVFSLVRRRMLRPVRKVSEAAQRVAKGDFSVRLTPMRRDGKKDEFEVLFDDFNTMAEELSSTETLKTDFISNVSHEMKTPLAVIRNYAELLETPGLSDDARAEYAKAIEDAAGKMTELVTNILRLNRIENQKIAPELRRYDVCRQLADCLLCFESRWEEKQIEPEFDLEDSAYINADENLLELVWNNLMSNALKFTEPGGTVTVRERTEGERVIVSFADTGCGIGEEAKKHIFDKFYQGDASHATEGNGLGLALVRRVMTLLGGEIAVESEAGKGSTFTVSLRKA
ncbi:MAG: HAMP domain-containing histidine kinase [Ruminococcaceae bacterium]|nr:HAMP domain-containing histidine kinase [Oscillospiraceae bacterium]